MDDEDEKARHTRMMNAIDDLSHKAAEAGVSHEDFMLMLHTAGLIEMEIVTPRFNKRRMAVEATKKGN